MPDDIYPGYRPDQTAYYSRRYGRLLDAIDQREARHRGTTRLSELSADSHLEWLLEDFLAIGEITLLVGEPSIGKSTLAAMLAALVSNSHNSSEYIRAFSNGSVLVGSTEENYKVIRDRMLAAGANLDNIVTIGNQKSYPGGALGKSYIDRLECDFKYAKSINNGSFQPRLIILDPIYQAVDGDFSSNAKCRSSLEALKAFAERNQCAILGVAHTVKRTDKQNLLNRVVNPPAMRQIPRLIFCVSRIASSERYDGATHILGQAKNNLTDVSRVLTFKIDSVPIRENTARSSKVEIVRGLEGVPDVLVLEAEKNEKIRVTKGDLACEILIEKIPPGTMVHAKEIIDYAESKGISKNTLIAAKEGMGIPSKKIEKKWFWVSPVQAEVDDDDGVV